MPTTIAPSPVPDGAASPAAARPGRAPLEETPPAAALPPPGPPSTSGHAAAHDAPPSSSSSPPPACYLVQHAIAKAANVGTLARVATAFGAAGVVVVSPSPKISTFGAHGADAHVRFWHFVSLGEAKAWLATRGVALVGVEIDPRARPVTRPGDAFPGPSAFLLGNEGDGLPPSSLALCDRLVYIPQYGPGTASLNVAVAAGIVLHAFASWAGFEERGRAGAKFSVGPRPLRTLPRGRAAPPDEALAAARAERRREGKEGEGAGLESGGLEGVFG